MNLALKLSERSTCRRPIAGGYGVGCVIASVDYRKILAVGYNGNASGLENDCDSTMPGPRSGTIARSRGIWIPSCYSGRSTNFVVKRNACSIRPLVDPATSSIWGTEFFPRRPSIRPWPWWIWCTS